MKVREKPMIQYPCTNESILAVLAGLTLQEGDIVVSIAGSGDIPFALAPHVDRVFAVDHNPLQLDFMREQMQALKERDYDLFFRMELEGDCLPKKGSRRYDVCKNDLARRKEFFELDFEQTRKDLGKIELVKGGIFDFLAGFKGWFDKVYLSNSIPLGVEKQGYFDGLREGGLVYETRVMFSNGLSCISNRQDMLEVDAARTPLARKIQNQQAVLDAFGWNPVVYKKRK